MTITQEYFGWKYALIWLLLKRLKIIWGKPMKENTIQICFWNFVSKNEQLYTLNLDELFFLWKDPCRRYSFNPNFQSVYMQGYLEFLTSMQKYSWLFLYSWDWVIKLVIFQSTHIKFNVIFVHIENKVCIFLNFCSH